MFHWYQIWRRMRELTNKEIEKRAVMEIIDYFETKIDAVIKQSIAELEKINKFKEIQGLRAKVRIDKDCVRSAIKAINSNRHSNLSEKKGGKQKKKKKIEKHLPEMNVLTEVT